VSTTFAEAATITSRLDKGMTKFQEHIVRELIEANRKAVNRISNESHRNRLKLEQFLSDNDITIQDMAEDFRLYTVPYGMSRDCSFSPRNA
jgi:hypothetical protein